VVDADALNLLAHDEIPKQRDNWILTPHPGEASRLLKTKIETIATDRPRYARELQRKHGGIAILKGMGTLIADPEHIHQCSHGNPGMATGGMGDILSGIIGGLLAQGFSLEDAACFGVELHAAAADIAAKKDGERGLMATDLLPPLRSLLNP
jgi:NAD(P)H-hydrate epimerase